MDVYGLSSPDFFRIDDLLDFPNDDLFPSSSSPAATATTSSASSSSFPPENSFTNHFPSAASFHHPSSSFLTDFTTHDLSIPGDDAAQLEWLSQFVDDSFSDFPANPWGGTMTVRPDGSFPGKPRSKRSRAPMATPGTWTPMPESDGQVHGQAAGKSKPKKEVSGRHQSAAVAPMEGEVRRCTHCASEKTPQWRTGPLGPKTLCNACGVRYKSGRLVPEYRPAASPTFVLTQHSNSHRKVMELRRQKEQLMMRQQQIQIQQHHHPPFQQQ